VVGEYATFCGKEVQTWDSFPRSVFQYLTRLFEEETVLKIEGIHSLFAIFQFEWSRLTDSQKAQLMLSISQAYSMQMTTMSRFVICELLGEYYANSQALMVLKMFGKMGPEERRVFVPHALEHFIRATSDPNSRADAMLVLESLSRDDSPCVRSEVKQALSKFRAPTKGDESTGT
jgi:hypothetical protein